MKKITLLFFLLAVSFGYSQTELLTNGDFENGTAPWVGGAEFSVVGGEAFISSTNAGGNPWDTQLVHGGLAFENAQEYTLTFYARAAADRNITVAIQNVNIWDDQFRQDFALTTTMTEYTATFNATSTNANVQIGFLMAGTTSTDAIYYDDISLVTDGAVAETCNDGILNNGETEIDCGGPNCDACPEPPTTAAPTPPNRPVADVISLYSGSYTDVAGNFDAGWCGGSSVSEIMIGGNATQQYLNNACQGIVFDAGIDASTFTNLHVDVYIQAGTDLTSSVFNLKFVQIPGGAALEINLNVASSPALVAGSWMSLDIPVDLTTFTSFKEFGITSNLHNKVWYDNLYVHKNTLGVNDFDLADFSLYPNPTNNVWNVKTQNQIIKAVKVFDVLGKQVISLNTNSNEVRIDATSLTSGLYFAKIQSETGFTTVKVVKN